MSSIVCTLCCLSSSFYLSNDFVRFMLKIFFPFSFPVLWFYLLSLLSPRSAVAPLCTFSCSFINMDFLFYFLLRITICSCFKIPFSFPCFSSPAISYSLQAVYSFFFLSSVHIPWLGFSLHCTFPK